MSNIQQALAAMTLCKGMGAAELQALSKLVFVNSYATAETVCAEGDASDFMCFVVSGTLRVLKRLSEEEEMAIATVTAGHSFGEMALLEKAPRSATVVAQRDSVIIILTRKGFEQFKERHPQGALIMLGNVASQLSAHLRRTSDQLAQFMPPLN